MIDARITIRCFEWPGLAAELTEYETRYRHRPSSNCPEVDKRGENIPHLLLRLAVVAGVVEAGWDVDPDHGEGLNCLARRGRSTSRRGFEHTWHTLLVVAS